MKINYQLRNGMVIVLQEAIRQANAKGRSLNMLRDTFEKLNSTEGYSTRTLKESRYIDSILYTKYDDAYEILEDGEPLFTVYRDQRDTMWVLEVYSADLMSREELIAELQLKAQIREELGECV